MPLTQPRVIEAAHQRAAYPIAYAHAFAAALARELDATVMTGDPEVDRRGDLIHVPWLRSNR